MVLRKKGGIGVLIASEKLAADLTAGRFADERKALRPDWAAVNGHFSLWYLTTVQAFVGRMRA